LIGYFLLKSNTLLIQGIVQKRSVNMKGDKTGGAIPIPARGLTCLTTHSPSSTFLVDKKGRLFFLYLNMGDGAAVSEENTLEVEAIQAAELLMFDLA
jgi:Quercetinase C-terminal cupin domain